MNNYDYGIIGNCTSAALVSRDCRIDWLCLPFFDSPSLFARILDEKKGGSFGISGAGTKNISQEYVQNTPILKTVFETDRGAFEVRDYMPRFKTARGEYYCPSEIHRTIRVISGRPRIKVGLDPGPNYALGPGEFELYRDYIKIVSTAGEYNSFYLYSDLDKQKILNAEPIELEGPAYLLLSYHEKLEDITQEKIFLEYVKTKTYWLDWVYRTKFPGEHKKAIVRSAITLKLLTYQRTGAVIAAPTTSLPEIIGAGRNWDYRYCWIRDASMIVDLYARIGHMHSATQFIGFILNRMLLKHHELSVMYGINGERQLTEKTLDHLEGYASSRPVRTGNDAYRQKQNDLYGQLIEAIYTYFVVNRRGMMHVDEEIWTVVRSLANDVIESWREPDSGIWERRKALKHYVHSKMMNWVAMDRAVKIARHVGKTRNVDKWLKIASEIREDILANGWNEKVGAFTMYYGGDTLDAANLLMLHYGFLDKDDPKMVSTVKRTYEHLVKNNFTFRYDTEDEFGLPENAFIVCTFWMINALYLIGEKEKAREMFDNILKRANRLGLFAEDVEITTGRLTGNFPQGYSHLALIQTLLLLETNYNWSDAFSAGK